MSVQARPAVVQQGVQQKESLQGFASTSRVADAPRRRTPVDTSRTALVDSMRVRCAGCGVDVLPRAPVVTLSDTDEALTHGGTDWHPGCWASHQRAALNHPPSRRPA